MSRRSPRSRPVDALVLGGSAGGVEGLSAVLPALQPNCGIAVFVVIHVRRDRPSLLVDIFQPKCRLRVTEAQDKEPVEPGTIYFAPPDYHLLIDEGPQLALAADELVHFSRPSIDVLFESAADAYGSRLIGIVLSGANDDGASGLKAVQAAGGLTLVQRPETAIAATMPRAALAQAPGSTARTIAQISELLRGVVAGGIQLDEVEEWTRG